MKQGRTSGITTNNFYFRGRLFLFLPLSLFFLRAPLLPNYYTTHNNKTSGNFQPSRSLNFFQNFISLSSTSLSSRLLKMISIPTLVTLLSTLATFTLAHSSPSRLNSRSDETHSSLVERAATCPPPVMAQYWPSWTGTQPPAQLDWKRADVAYYFGSSRPFRSVPSVLFVRVQYGCAVERQSGHWVCKELIRLPFTSSASPTTSNGLTLPVGASFDGLKTFVAAAKQAGKRPGLTIGGWEGSRYFSNLVATVANRTKFANTVKSWVDQYGFTSVSFDWEFIGKQGAGNNVVRAADAANLIKFFATLRTTLGSGVTIAADVPAGG